MTRLDPLTDVKTTLNVPLPMREWKLRALTNALGGEGDLLKVRDSQAYVKQALALRVRADVEKLIAEYGTGERP